MPKLSTERVWSNGRHRKVLKNRLRTPLRQVFQHAADLGVVHQHDVNGQISRILDAVVREIETPEFINACVSKGDEVSVPKDREVAEVALLEIKKRVAKG